MRQLSPSKWRRLQMVTTARGVFSILALDHRGNLRRVLNSADGDERLRHLKRQIVAALAPVSSAVLLDPQTGLLEMIASGELPGHTALIATLDATGYSGDPHARGSRVLEGWSVEKAARLGAAGVKLLVYYHPEAPNAPDQERLVREVAADCARFELPFFLEPLSFSPYPKRPTLAPVERREVVMESARRLSIISGVDVLKAEFPVDVEAEPAEDTWHDTCRALTEACPIPWVLLSAGVDFETYMRQVRVACAAGASGVMAGRAIWHEAVNLQGDALPTFLHNTARQRMADLVTICDTEARPFSAVLGPPEASSEWFVAY